jgi:hypothetical protein
MRLTQISAFLENRPGRLLRLLSILAEAGVNVLAHDITDAADFGIVHLIVDDPDKALRAMDGASITSTSTTVLAVDISNTPGAFVEQVLKPLAPAGVNIKYSYSFSAPGPQAAGVTTSRVVLKVNDMDRAEAALGAIGGR